MTVFSMECSPLQDIKGLIKTYLVISSDTYLLMPDNQDVDSLALDAIMSGHIRRVLDMTSGRVGGKQGAAYLLNINPSTLRKKMRKLGISFGRKARKG